MPAAVRSPDVRHVHDLIDLLASLQSELCPARAGAETVQAGDSGAQWRYFEIVEGGGQGRLGDDHQVWGEGQLEGVGVGGQECQMVRF